MVLGSLIAGAAGGATVSIIINAVDNFSRTFGKANAGMAKLGAGLTAVGIAGAFAVGGILKLAGGLEQSTIAFTTMLGSAEKADKLLRDLTEFAARTPFTIPGIRQNAKMLLAMSIELDDLLPTLKTLGDVSAGLSVPLDRLAINFGQVKVQGRLTGRELRDFAVAGVPLIAELAKNLNKSEAEIKDMVSAGKIGFKDVEKAFQTMSGEGGIFFNLMEEQNKSLFGQISNVTDNFIKLGEEMGQHLLPIAKTFAEVLVKITSLFEEHPTIAKYVTITLALGTAFALIVGPLLIMVAILPAMAAGFGILAGALSLANFQLAITRLLLIGPGGMILALGALAAILLFKHAQSITETADAYNIFGIAIDTNLQKIKDLADEMERLKRATEVQKKTREFIPPISPELQEQFDFMEKFNLFKFTEQQELSKAQRLVKQAQDAGLKVVQTRFATEGGLKAEFDVFDPSDIRREDFNTRSAFRNALQGGGLIINIENINGIDPDEIAEALRDKLNDMINAT